MSNTISNPVASENDEDLMGFAPLSIIKQTLDKIFGKLWVNWEIETIALELKMALSDLTSDKIHVLQIMAKDPEKFYTDMAFFLYATEVINNKVADFEFLPTPTSLEIGYAIKETDKLLAHIPHKDRRSDDVKDLVTYILREEGYSEPVVPFEFIPKDDLEPGQTPQDTEAKKRALELYIQHMGDL